MNILIKVSILISVACCHLFTFASESSLTTTTVTQQAAWHIVLEGESLFSIAQKYHLTVHDLQKLNPIINADKITVGQKINLIINENVKADLNSNNLIVSLRQQAEIALTAQDYPLAIKLLTRLYQQGNDSDRQFALEFLGVSREKKNQKAFAKQAYQTFLKNYPQAETASRVKLRLDNLIGIETLTKDRSFKNNTAVKQRSQSYYRGSLAANYRHGVSVNNNGQSKNTLSLANVDFDAKGAVDQDGYDIGFRVSVGHYQDLRSGSDNTNQQIRYLNLSAKSDDKRYQVSIGRQRSRGKGIFGRFDGLVLSSELYSDVQVNLVAGYPVASSKVTHLDPERQFYGLSVDIDNTWLGLDVSLFVFEQTINELTDRRAIGGELSYIKDAISLYSLIDYDMFFDELNAFLLSGSYSTKSAQRFSWSMNYRKSPYAATRNALIGQNVDSFTELQNLLITDEEILDLALNKTLTSKTVSLQYFQPINETYDISSSITYMDLTGAYGISAVPAVSESNAQYYGNIYLSARNIYSKKDTNSFGFRYSSLPQSDVYSIYATSQYRFENGLSITPKLRYDNRSNDNNTSQQSIAPTLRIQYQGKKHSLYGDMGGIFYNAESTLLPTQKTKIYFLYLGYRYYF